MKKNFLVLLLLFVSASAFSQLQTKQSDSDTSVFEALNKDRKSEFFAEALKKSGLSALLKKGTYTLFVPSDDAFKMIPDSLLNDTAFVSELVKNSIVAGNYNRSVLTQSITQIAEKTIQLRTLSGNMLTLHLNKDHNLELYENKTPVSLITIFDIPFSGGIIHQVNHVFYPME